MKAINRIATLLVLTVMIGSLILVCTPTSVYADSLDLYWINGTGNWSDTSHWATAADGTGAGHAAPTSTNNVFFGASSFTGANQTVTVDAAANCLDMNWTGATNTPTLAGSQALNIYGSRTLISAMVYSHAGTTFWRATSAGKTITNAGLTLTDASRFAGVGGAWTLQDNWISTGLITLESTGTIITNNKTVSCTSFIDNSSGVAKTLTLGSSVINCTGWNFSTGGLTLTANTATINSSGVFSGGGITTYNIVNLTGATSTISGSNTFAQLNLASGTTQTISFTDGTTQTITTPSLSGTSTSIHTLQGTSTGGWTISVASGTVNAAWTTISYSTATGGATFNALAAVDSGNNSGWNFDNNVYWVGGTGNWSDATNHWSLTSGGSGGAGNVPIATRGVKFDASSFSGASQTVTVDATANCKDMDWAGATNTPTFNRSGSYTVNIYGSCTFIAAMVVSQTYGINMMATTTGKTFTAGGTIATNLAFSGVGGGWTLQDNLNIGAGALSVTNGALDTNGKTVTCGAFATGSTATTVTLGASVINCTSWTKGSGALTLTANTATINCSGNFSGGGITTYNIVNLTGATPTISGSNTLADLRTPSETTQTISFTDGTTQTVTAAFLSGSAGHVHTLQGTSTGGWTITKAGGGRITSGYVTVSNSTANPDTTFYAWPNGTDGGNNTRWYFYEPLDDVPMQPGVLYSKDIIVTLLNQSQFSVTWEAKPGATYLVQAKRFRNPLSPTDGYFVYTGTSNVCTAVRESNTRYIVYWLDTSGTWILWANQNVYRNGVY